MLPFDLIKLFFVLFWHLFTWLWRRIIFELAQQVFLKFFFLIRCSWKVFLIFTVGLTLVSLHLLNRADCNSKENTILLLLYVLLHHRFKDKATHRREKDQMVMIRLSMCELINLKDRLHCMKGKLLWRM